MPKLGGDVEISSSFYMLQISLFSGTSSGSMNGGGRSPWLGRYWGRDSLWGAANIMIVMAHGLPNIMSSDINATVKKDLLILVFVCE